MSAGAFTRTFYETDGGDILRARVQPETLAANIGAVNSAPAGPADAPGSARVGGGRRQFGVKMRSVTLAWTGTPPTGYLAGSTVRIPIMQQATYDDIDAGDTGTYRGVAVEVVGKSPESVR